MLRSQARMYLMLVLVLFLQGTTVLAQSGKMTLAAYNTEWLLDVFDDPYTSDEHRAPKSREGLVALAKALRAVNADVVGISELENEGVLRAFVAELLPDMGYQFVAAQPTNSDRGQNLGIISRFPIEKLTSYRFVEVLPAQTVGNLMVAPKRMARDLALITLRGPDNRQVHVIVVHFKSKFDGEGDPKSQRWRSAEATFARQQIESLLVQNPQALVAMLGDFNDTPESPTLATLLEKTAHGQIVLLDAHRDMPMDQRITYLKEPYRKQGPIDYILLSPSLDRLRVPGSARVLDDPSLLSGSDHAPIYVTLDFDRQ